MAKRRQTRASGVATMRSAAPTVGQMVSSWHCGQTPQASTKPLPKAPRVPQGQVVSHGTCPLIKRPSARSDANSSFTAQYPGPLAVPTCHYSLALGLVWVFRFKIIAWMKRPRRNMMLSVCGSFVTFQVQIFRIRKCPRF